MNTGAKTDRLDTELLKRAFLGWLRGERDHCKMVTIPTIEDEDAKRPNRERESLVGEQTRIVNRMKAALSRLGIRGFNPKLKRPQSASEICARPRASQAACSSGRYQASFGSMPAETARSSTQLCGQHHP